MNKDQGAGIVERGIYAVILAVAMKFVAWGYITADMAPWIAAGGVGLAGGAYAWWINRPKALMNKAAGQIPDNARLVIEVPANAGHEDRKAARDLADASNEKVVAVPAS